MANLANSPWLDGVWLVLVLAALAGSLLCAAGFLARYTFGDLNPRALKWFWRLVHVQLLGLVAWAVAGRCLSEVHTCFADFLRAGGASSFTRILAFAWLMGLALFAIADLVRLLSVYRRSRRWRAGRAFAGVPLQVRVCEEARSPFVFGVLQPVLVLPAEPLPLNEAQMRAVIAHEMAHVRDGDMFFGWIELIFRRLLFFHPAVYVAASAYALVQEKAADQRALDTLGIAPAEYARAFMNLIEWNFAGRISPWPAVGAVSSFRALRARLLFIDGYRRDRRLRAWRVVLPATLLLAGGWSTAQPAHTAASHAPGMCVQVQHEKFFEQLLHIEAEPKSCEPEVP